MLEKNIIKIIEIFTLGFVFPILVVYFSLSNYILIFLWIIFLYTFIIFIRLYKEPNLFKNAFNLIQLRKYFFFIILRWFFALIVLCYFTKFFFPEKLFLLQKNDNSLLYKIFILFYSILLWILSRYRFFRFYFRISHCWVYS